MNLRYLGDALDHWKGSLLERLQSARLLNRLSVDAMASDAPDWTDSDWKLFATLLRIAPTQIIRHRAALSISRSDYFREVSHPTDIFLDPDTGIATGRIANASQYLRPTELHALLAARPSRVVGVYQHIRAVSTRDRLTKIMSVLSSAAQPLCCCSYESSTVAMLFFSRDLLRIKAIYDHHSALLGRHSASRTHLWRPNKVA
jgi:hypothetical protein